MIVQSLKGETKVYDKLFKENKDIFINSAQSLKIYQAIGISPLFHKRGKKLLDLGCGAGIHSLNFAEMGFQVTGIDISVEGLKTAKKKAQKKSLKIKFPLRDILKNKFASESFDIVIFMNSLHHFYYSGLEKALQEAKRVLKKSGIIIICEPNNLHFYNYLAYSIAHFFKKHQSLINFRYLNETFTVNERSLNPYKLLSLLEKDFRLLLFKFFPYTAVLNKRRKILNILLFFFPGKYRFDHFSLKLIKK